MAFVRVSQLIVAVDDGVHVAECATLLDQASQRHSEARKIGEKPQMLEAVKKALFDIECSFAKPQLFNIPLSIGEALRSAEQARCSVAEHCDLVQKAEDSGTETLGGRDKQQERTVVAEGIQFIHAAKDAMGMRFVSAVDTCKRRFFEAYIPDVQALCGRKDRQAMKQHLVLNPVNCLMPKISAKLKKYIDCAKPLLSESDDTNIADSLEQANKMHGLMRTYIGSVQAASVLWSPPAEQSESEAASARAHTIQLLSNIDIQLHPWVFEELSK